MLDEGARRDRGFIDAVRDLEHSAVNLLQRIDTLLKLNVVRRQLGLSYATSAYIQCGIISVARGDSDDYLGCR